MSVKPFYIKYEDWMTDEQVAEVLDKAVSCGAELWEGVRGIHMGAREETPSAWGYFGVHDGNCTYFDDADWVFGDDAILLTIDQVDEHLGLSKPDSKQVFDLRNTKIDLRKEDGSVDEELSKAFQEACFEQGIVWSCDDTIAKYTDRNFILANSDYKLRCCSLQENFEDSDNKEVKFNYNRTLEWNAEYIEPTVERKIVTICGKEYYEDELENILSALKSAEVK